MTELAYWLKLTYSKGISSACIHALLAQFGSAEDACKANHQDLSKFGLETLAIQSLNSEQHSHAINDALKWCEQDQHHIVTVADANYPKLLKNVINPPPLLYIKGDISITSEPQVAIVGSRNPTASGQQTAFEFAKYLSRSGLIITSGLAIGIDAASHQGALSINTPTIAVMATGIDQVYPAKHRRLADEILEKKGALVTEFPLGTQPRPALFPQRNRIISGLSIGTLVVEAAIRSGSLITARHALEQAREVFAIPGSIHSPQARGCHKLIKDGAKLVESVQDIIEEIAPGIQLALQQIDSASASPNSSNEEILDDEYQQLLAQMSYDALSVDELINRTKLPAESVASMLMILELKGLIGHNSDGRYCRLQTAEKL